MSAVVALEPGAQRRIDTAMAWLHGHAVPREQLEVAEAAVDAATASPWDAWEAVLHLEAVVRQAGGPSPVAPGEWGSKSPPRQRSDAGAGHLPVTTPQGAPSV